ncbi:unnamed protein product [Merluccius merluccius]
MTDGEGRDKRVGKRLCTKTPGPMLCLWPNRSLGKKLPHITPKQLPTTTTVVWATTAGLWPTTTGVLANNNSGMAHNSRGMAHHSRGTAHNNSGMAHHNRGMVHHSVTYATKFQTPPQPLEGSIT